MADIVVTNQIDRTQRFAFYEVDNTLASVLVAAGLATYAAPKAAPKTLPEWGVSFNKVAERYYIRHIVGATTTMYDGPAAGAKREFPDCPQSVIDELADAQKQAATEQHNRLRLLDKPKTSYR